MTSSSKKYLIKLVSLILLVGGLSFAQSFGFSLLGVKPNLAMVAVVACAFFAADFFETAFLVLLAALILKFGPGVESGIAAFSIIGIIISAAAKLVPWRYFVGNLIAVAVAILAFYAFLSPGLILSQVFFRELFLDIIFSSVIFAFLSFLWQDK